MVTQVRLSVKRKTKMTRIADVGAVYVWKKGCGGLQLMRGKAMREVDLVRPDLGKYPLGEKGFLAWGPMWGWHYDYANKWVKGQVDGQGCHEGYDVLCPEGTTLLAPCTGKVTIAGVDQRWSKFGTMVQIESTDHKAYTLVNLAHLSRLNVVSGDVVIRGETVLGWSGDTGNTGNPPFAHCHIGCRGENGEPLPIKWV